MEDSDDDGIEVIINKPEDQCDKNVHRYSSDEFKEIQEYYNRTFNITDENATIVAFHVDGVTFGCLGWLLTPTVPFLHLKEYPTNWVACETQRCKTNADSWMHDFNEKYLNGCLFKRDNITFIFIEVAFLKFNKNKLVHSWSAAKCEVKENKMRVIDLLQCKMECNFSNSAFGNWKEFFSNVDYIYVYCPESGNIKNFFASTIFPWSPIFSMFKDKFCNLLPYYQFNKHAISQNCCFDAQIHQIVFGCSFCNLINSLVNLGNKRMLATKRPPRETLPDLIPMHLIGNANLIFKKCKGKTYINGDKCNQFTHKGLYNRGTGSIIVKDSVCSCQE